MRKHFTRLFLALLAVLLVTACAAEPTRLPAPPTPEATAACPVTAPNGKTPPGEQPSAAHYGNEALVTVLWPNGTVLVQADQVERDGTLGMKFPWWRLMPGVLSIEGRRLDAVAPPLRAQITDGYGDRGLQATRLFFPAAGCWQVTGKLGDASLTFVTRVVRAAP
ncbi:MAG: hypothetical protein HZB53_20770 [Chloroflexi bacterium]|nr:hypothetical protein [Chloroflexota bacterium]